MAINITKYTRYVPWDEEGVGASRRRSAGAAASLDLSMYYTISELQTIGMSEILFDNIVEAYHNKTLGLQGGRIIVDSSDTPSTGDDEFYHLDEEDYLNLVGINFGMSIDKDSENVVTLVNDQDTPGTLKYYGTDINGTKGWYDLPEESSSSTGGESLWQEDSIGDLSPITAGAGIYVDGLSIKNYTIQADADQDIYIVAGASSPNGKSIYLDSGENDWGGSNCVFLGSPTTAGTYRNIKAEGSEDWIELHIRPKGNYGDGTTLCLDAEMIRGYLFDIWGYGGEGTLTLQASSFRQVSDFYILAADANTTFQAGNLTIRGGYASTAEYPDGGNLYIRRGYSVIPGGQHGHIYIGEGVGASLCDLEIDDTETYLVAIDPATGLLSRRSVASLGIEEDSSNMPGWVDVYGTPPTNPSSGEHEIAVWYDADTITYIDGFKTVQWVGGYNVLHAPFGTIYGGEYAWKSAPVYWNDRFYITALDGDETYPNGTNISIVSGSPYSGGGLGGRIYIHVADAISPNKAERLTLLGSTNSDANAGSGGDVYIESGYCYSDNETSLPGDIYISTGYKYTYEGYDILAKGFIYFGDGYEGCLPEADSSQIYVVYYDPTDGKLSYGEVGAGTGGTEYTFIDSLQEDSSGNVSLDNDQASPGNYKFYGTDASGNKGWYDLQTVIELFI